MSTEILDRKATTLTLTHTVGIEIEDGPQTPPLGKGAPPMQVTEARLRYEYDFTSRTWGGTCRLLAMRVKKDGGFYNKRPEAVYGQWSGADETSPLHELWSRLLEEHRPTSAPTIEGI